MKFISLIIVFLLFSKPVFSNSVIGNIIDKKVNKEVEFWEGYKDINWPPALSPNLDDVLFYISNLDAVNDYQRSIMRMVTIQGHELTRPIEFKEKQSDASYVVMMCFVTEFRYKSAYYLNKLFSPISWDLTEQELNLYKQNLEFLETEMTYDPKIHIITKEDCQLAVNEFDSWFQSLNTKKNDALLSVPESTVPE
ncbi:hypothetical protein [Photobacterium leiognathi]|uniref:hypothetical protein n=1 Tax=Photobacterium leiognathi TaxID=553611 RepID=UPI0029811F9E|nr:hypothetical protein [Photobacterium leiognathi]